VDSLRGVLDTALKNLDKSGLISFDFLRPKSNKKNLKHAILPAMVLWLNLSYHYDVWLKIISQSQALK